MATFDEYKTALEGKLTELKTAVDNVSIETDAEGTVHLDEKQFNDITAIKSEVHSLRNAIETTNEAKEIRAWLEAPNDSPAAFGGREEAKDLSEAFLDSPEFKDMLQSKGFNMRAPFEVNRADIAGDGFYGTKASGSGGLWTGTTYAQGTQSVRNVGTVVQSSPLQPRPQQTQRVRDLFPSASTSSNLIEYFQVHGFNNAAATVAEYTGDATTGNFGLKPKSGISFRQAQDPVRTVAHWTPIHRNMLADVPQMRSVLQTELMYGLKLAEDAQLLSGDGQGENLLGILNRPGIQQHAQGTTDTKAEAIRRAITKSALALFPASGIIMHPNDWEDVELIKAEGDGQYVVAQNVVVGAQSRLWRLPVVETPVIPEGTALVGAFGQAAKIWDREQANLRIAEQHEDFFTRNAVVLLVEERLGLSMERPEGIVEVTFKA